MEKNSNSRKIKGKATSIRQDFFNDNRISDHIIWYMIGGIAGCILMGASDWLMIYGDVTVKGNVEWLTEGAASIEPWRNAVAMILAFPAVIFYAIGLFGIQDVFVFSRQKEMYKGLTVIGLTPWLAVHLFYVMMLFAFGWLRGNGEYEIAFSLIEAITEQFWWLIPAGEFLMALPFVYLMIMCFADKTRFHPAMGLNNPLYILAVLKLVSYLMKSSPLKLAFTNGLMSESMFIFFLIYVVAFSKIRK